MSINDGSQVFEKRSLFFSPTRRDHQGTVTAIEFLHRFYAANSMVTNDRFVSDPASSSAPAPPSPKQTHCPLTHTALSTPDTPPQLMSMACLYLAGKVADSPKSSRDVVVASIECISDDPAEASRRYQDREWLAAAREQVNRAERALLYHLGFRFGHTTVPATFISMLQVEPLVGFLATAFPDPATRTNFNHTCLHVCNQSCKVPLVLQYPPEAVAAACVWFVMKLYKLDTTPLRTVSPGRQPWYAPYGLGPAELEIIASQLRDAVLGDVEMAEELGKKAAAMGAAPVNPPSEPKRPRSSLDRGQTPSQRPVKLEPKLEPQLEPKQEHYV